MVGRKGIKIGAGSVGHFTQGFESLTPQIMCPRAQRAAGIGLREGGKAIRRATIITVVEHRLRAIEVRLLADCKRRVGGRNPRNWQRNDSCIVDTAQRGRVAERTDITARFKLAKTELQITDPVGSIGRDPVHPMLYLLGL